MSTLQHTKPRWANQSITEESGRPGTARSNVGCDAIEEPCTKSTAGLASGESTYFSQRKSRTSPSGVFFCAQCATPVTCVGLSIANPPSRRFPGLPSPSAPSPPGRRYRIPPASNQQARCRRIRSEEHTSELQSLAYLVCRLLLEKKKTPITRTL